MRIQGANERCKHTQNKIKTQTQTQKQAKRAS